MREAIIGLIGALIGGIITAIPIYFQELGKMKRWKIEKKISILEKEISDIEKAKKLSLKDLNSLFKKGKLADHEDFVISVPMEIIDIFKKYLPDQKELSASGLPESVKSKIFTESATAFENKINSTKDKIKKLLFS